MKYILKTTCQGRDEMNDRKGKERKDAKERRFRTRNEWKSKRMYLCQ